MQPMWTPLKTESGLAFVGGSAALMRAAIDVRPASTATAPTDPARPRNRRRLMIAFPSVRAAIFVSPKKSGGSRIAEPSNLEADPGLVSQRETLKQYVRPQGPMLVVSNSTR